ncbi:hypothetical protein Barb6_02355 [Bacteroidales bacterium Barb6]|nr:hypothetical protein Barb6_02355 [Bacteroidales bacterium Barb6]
MEKEKIRKPWTQSRTWENVQAEFRTADSWVEQQRIHWYNAFEMQNLLPQILCPYGYNDVPIGDFTVYCLPFAKAPVYPVYRSWFTYVYLEKELNVKIGGSLSRNAKDRSLLAWEVNGWDVEFSLLIQRIGYAFEICDKAKSYVFRGESEYRVEIGGAAAFSFFRDTRMDDALNVKLDKKEVEKLYSDLALRIAKKVAEEGIEPKNAAYTLIDRILNAGGMIESWRTDPFKEQAWDKLDKQTVKEAWQTRPCYRDLNQTVEEQNRWPAASGTKLWYKWLIPLMDYAGIKWN